jgi:O-antigen/teichoic acid export membrane protein
LSVFNGLVFILLVTRHLTQHDFGLWQLILSIITYSALPNVVVDYWAIRGIARGQRVATTAVLFSIILSLVGIAIYTITAFSLGSSLGHDILILAIAMIQVPLTYQGEDSHQLWAIDYREKTYHV